MNVQQTAEYFGVGTRHIYKMAQGGQLPAYKFGESWRFSRQAIQKWSEEQAVDNLR
jgi:excisionase family DNA binding protein